MIATDGLTLVPVGFTNCYVLDSGEGLILIDTGINTDENWDALTAGLRAAGYEVRDVRLVLLTHYHFDHSGLAERVRQASGARVLIHQDDAPLLAEGGRWRRQTANHRRLLQEHGVPARLLDWLDRTWERRGRHWYQDWHRQEPLFDGAGQVRWSRFEQETPPPQDQEQPPLAPGDAQAHPDETAHHTETPSGAQPPIIPDGTVCEREVIAQGRLRLRAVHTPGHTPGHVCFLIEDAGVLFTGDHVLKHVAPNPAITFLGSRYEGRTRSIVWYVQSLQKVRDLPAQRVFPAHEQEVPDLPQRVDRILRNHERRAAQIRATLQGGATTAFDLLPALFPNLRVSALWTALSGVIGHLDLLEDRGEVEAVPLDGRIAYLRSMTG
ncbi:MAG: MBL fold metallo-hydrolase [Chloroflexi bacterium]|nr:MBL fold metallo-hydrolase [Chloroflexota bacterium]